MFGGDLDDLFEATGAMIPTVVQSCVDTIRRSGGFSLQIWFTKLIYLLDGLMTIMAQVGDEPPRHFQNRGRPCEFYSCDSFELNWLNPLPFSIGQDSPPDITTHEHFIFDWTTLSLFLHSTFTTLHFYLRLLSHDHLFPSFRMTSTHLEELPEQGQPVLL